jgi:predicted HAD superfamily Cof-like phosphohydrolase
MFAQVKEFQKTVLNNWGAKPPSVLSFEESMYLVKCVNEELAEFKDARLSGDLAGMADALADAIYFLLGFAAKMGLPFDEIWDIVHEANMQKVAGKTKRGMPNDAAKPPDWKDPKDKIKELLYGPDPTLD